MGIHFSGIEGECISSYVHYICVSDTATRPHEDKCSHGPGVSAIKIAIKLVGVKKKFGHIIMFTVILFMKGSCHVLAKVYVHLVLVNRLGGLSPPWNYGVPRGSKAMVPLQRLFLTFATLNFTVATVFLPLLRYIYRCNGKH